jgi:hypothetical protein
MPYTVGMDEKTLPTDTKTLNVRGLPTWVSDAINAYADKYNMSFSDKVRLILAEWATTHYASVPEKE